MVCKLTENDVVIKSWKQLVEEVYRNSWKPQLGRYRSDYAFRGLSDASYQLKNSFYAIADAILSWNIIFSGISENMHVPANRSSPIRNCDLWCWRSITGCQHDCLTGLIPLLLPCILPQQTPKDSILTV